MNVAKPEVIQTYGYTFPAYFNKHFFGRHQIAQWQMDAIHWTHIQSLLNRSIQPFRKLDEAGVIVTVNSDDPPLFNTTLVQEYAVLVTHFGYDRDNLIRIARNAFEHAAVDQNTKDKFLIDFESKILKLTRRTK